MTPFMLLNKGFQEQAPTKTSNSLTRTASTLRRNIIILSLPAGPKMKNWSFHPRQFKGNPALVNMSILEDAIWGSRLWLNIIQSKLGLLEMSRDQRFTYGQVNSRDQLQALIQYQVISVMLQSPQGQFSSKLDRFIKGRSPHSMEH